MIVDMVKKKKTPAIEAGAFCCRQIGKAWQLHTAPVHSGTGKRRDREPGHRWQGVQTRRVGDISGKSRE